MKYKKIIIYNRTKKNAEIIKKDLLEKHPKNLPTKINCENLKKIKK